ncbi:sigma-70 family RNA polymerase sigma factor [Phenylobacterium deserti]|uniref:RNA polymerase sigma factor SigJ n=1 Tax=Phenylobacterium deserti TaxID=1914756 RepID=A0A328AU63_9CAUL|nr:sigma-70 family RNA polymerase sigma factor [Phenylobacterium deserti]RAK57064.1 RNA polymerase sigma factor SigJ [Phenylobacterium deserti]
MRRPDETVSVFEAHRPRLVRLAYRMLGSVAEAEDVVQNAWLRWQGANAEGVREPAAWLTRTVTRLSLDVLKSARMRRETYVGAWLPEPLVQPEAEEGELHDDLTLTLMLALERLSPLERAAFLLHDVFGVEFEEVASTLGREPAAARQLAARARRHVQDARPRFPIERSEGEKIAQAFFDASRTGDVAALRSLLAEGVTLRSDGGGKVIAFLNPIHGLEKVLRLYSGLRRKFDPASFVHLRSMWIDGLPGYASIERGQVLQTTALDIEGGRIVGIYITRNPDKLAHVARELGLPSAPLH